MHAPSVATPADFMRLLAAGALAVGVVVFVMIRSGLAVGLHRLARQLACVLEPAALLALLAYALGWPLITAPPFGCGEQKLGDMLLWGTTPVPREMILPPIAVGFLMLAAVIVCLYLFRNRTLFLCAGTATTFLIFYLFLRWDYLPFLRNITSFLAQSQLYKQLRPPILVPRIFNSFRECALPIIAVLGGLYCSRHGFRPWKYLLGAFVAALLAGYAARPFMFLGVHGLLFQALLFAVIARIMTLMPLCRARLESLTGLRLSQSVEPGFAPPTTLLQSLVAHVILGLLLLIVVLSAIVSWAEAETMRMLYVECRPTYRTPAARNAHADLRRLFLRTSPGIVVSGTDRTTGPVASLGKVVMDNRDIRDDAYWKNADVKRLYSAYEQMEPYTAAYRAASEKDYLEDPRARNEVISASGRVLGSGMSFLNVRECSRFMRVHALLCIRDGRTTEALADIQAVIGFGGLTKNGPSLVSQMIGVAVRGIGVETAYDFYTVYRDDPEKMRALAATLDHVAPKARTGLSLAGLSRGEPAFAFPLLVMPECTMPSFVRAETNTNSRWLQFDLLRVAVALELFRADQGQYPDRLQRLVPSYLSILPVDPFQGLPFVYENKGNEFLLESAGEPDPAIAHGDSPPYSFLRSVAKPAKEKTAR